MTEEEMRAEILKIENEKKEIEEKYETVNSQIEEKDKEISSLNETVSSLKQKNYDLFIKIENKPLEKKEEKEKEIETGVNDLINKILED